MKIQPLATSPHEHDPRELPTYPVTDAARLLRIPSATLRSWVFGRDYETADGARRFRRVIEPPRDPHSRLSFTNLIEAHVLRALRTKHGIAMQDVRSALDFAQREYGIQRLLIHEKLEAAPGRLFLGESSKSTITVDPRVSFGDPVTSHGSIRTAVIADRYEAGESIEDLASDYDLQDAEIEDAILFERAA